MLDLGKNRLYDISDIFRIAQCRKITSLNLSGNKKLNEADGYIDKVVASCPQLLILDNKKLADADANKNKRVSLAPSTLSPQPSALNPQPSALSPQPSTLNPYRILR